METMIASPERLWLMVMVFVTASLGVVMAFRRRQIQNRLGQAGWNRWNVGVGRAPWMSIGLLCTAFFLLTLTLIDLRWGKVTREVPQKGIEVMFALDVSRSMLAEDASPNRLERAKQQIRDLMEELAGDRVGLVAFAGEARVMIPLTRHYEDFKNTLDSITPENISRGGSRLGDAIEVAAAGFLDKTRQHRVIVVLTDGEDQESYPVEVTRRVHEESGVRVFTIGLGDTRQGARVPEPTLRPGQRGERFLTYKGNTVWSKLDGETLEAVALASEGAYIPAGTQYVDMSQVYQRYIAPIEPSEFETAKVETYEARFQWFALPVFLCLLVELVWATGRERRMGMTDAGTIRVASVVAGVMVTLTPALSFAQTVSTTSAEREQIQQGNQLIRQQQYEKALEAFEGIGPQPDRRVTYNRGLAFHGTGQLEAAAEAFENAAASPDPAVAAQSRYNLGNTLVELARQSDQDRAQAMLQKAIQSYQDALRIQSDHPDARANIETAFQEWKRLKHQDAEPEDSRSSPEQSQGQNQDQQDPQQGQQQGQQPDPGSQPGQDQQEDPSGSDASQEDGSSDSQGNESSSGQDLPEENGANDPTGDSEAGDNSDSSTQASEQPGQAEQSSGVEGDSSSDSQGQGASASDDGQEQRESGAGDSEQRNEPEEKDAAEESSNEGSSQQDSEGAGLENGETASPSADPQSGQSGNESDPSQSEETREGTGAEAMQNGAPDTRQNQSGRQQPTEGAAETGADSRSPGETANGGSNEDAVKSDQDVDGTLSSANQNPGQPMTASASGDPAKTMTIEEARKLLQAIRDRELRRRLNLQERRRRNRVPVEKDW